MGIWTGSLRNSINQDGAARCTVSASSLRCACAQQRLYKTSDVSKLPQTVTDFLLLHTRRRGKGLKWENITAATPLLACAAQRATSWDC